MIEQTESKFFDSTHTSQCLNNANLQLPTMQKSWSADDAMNTSDSSLTTADHNLRGAEFHGSFAPLTQKRKSIPKKPWYRRKEYFTHGWLDPHVWRAGVSRRPYLAFLFPTPPRITLVSAL